MTPRDRVLDWLHGRRGDAAGRLRELSAGPARPGGPVPVRPTRLVVSGRSPLMDYYRPAWLRPLDPRMRLWRDTAAVLVVFALVVVVSDWLPKPVQTVLSETFAPSQTLGAPQTSEPSAIAGAPSSTPTEVAETASPAASAAPSAHTPARTPRPRATPRPSVPPSATPGASATPEPPSPSPSPAESPSPSPSSSPLPSDSPAPSDSPSPEPPSPEPPSPSPSSASPGP